MDGNPGEWLHSGEVMPTAAGEERKEEEEEEGGK